MTKRLMLSLLFIALHACTGGSSTTIVGDGTVVDGDGNSNGDGNSGGDGSSNGGGDGNSNGGSDGNSNGGGDGNSNGGSTGNGSGVVSGLTAFHRSGQTFLTWPEPNAQARYHVYRHNAPINTNNISSATRLTERWGSLGPDTSRNTYGTENVPNFIIQDLGTPLADSTGLFVYTVPSNQQGSYYYAVTSVVNGSENTNIVPGNNSLSAAVSEGSSTPRPVLVKSVNGGKGRIYQQYMDYANWNPTFNGYAYEFGVTLPHNYNPNISYPVQLWLHAFGGTYTNLPSTEYEWEVIQVNPFDPGSAYNSEHSWWYGYATDHNYLTTDSPPSQGTITNFTEQRVVAAVRSVLNASDINSDNELTHIVGGSMGGSGAVALALRYPALFSGVYAGQPMMNYKTSPTFQSNFVKIWGDQQSNLPIVNGGPDSGSIVRFGFGQNAQTGVWDWMNHFQQLRRRSAEDFGYLMIDHGKADRTIDWQTQGQPLVSALTDARAGFSANARGDQGHTWTGFAAVVKPVFGLGYGDEFPWRYPVSLSYPAIQNASGSSSINPGPTGDSSYNMNIEWSTEANSFGGQIVDSSNRYEITIRSNDTNQTADITPRRTRSFNPSAGQQCSWNAVNVSGGGSASGNATVAANGLLTAVGVPIFTGAGTRLTISC